MRVKEIVKDYNFTLIAESVKPDSHRRLTLPLTECSGTYRIYANTSGQIVLDPVEKKNDN